MYDVKAFRGMEEAMSDYMVVLCKLKIAAGRWNISIKGGSRIYATFFWVVMMKTCR